MVLYVRLLLMSLLFKCRPTGCASIFTRRYNYRHELENNFKLFSYASSSKLEKTRISNSINAEDVVVQYPFDRMDLPDDTIFIVDGTSLVFQSYFSYQSSVIRDPNLALATLSEELSSELRPILKYLQISIQVPTQVASTDLLTNNEHIPCGPLVAFTSHFVRLLNSTRPRYLAIVFDAGSRTFRNTLYPPYKQQRPSRPPDMELLFLLAPRVLEIFGCRCLKQPNYEADDVMATLGYWAKERGLNVVHVSPDKDMLQLVSTGVHVYNPRTNNYIGSDEVERDLGVKPNQVADYFALMGDAADNIPGVPGVGKKAGMALIKHFGCVEELILRLRLNDDMLSSSLEYEDCLAELTEALVGCRVSKQKLLRALRETSKELLLYKELTTLRLDTPISAPEGLGFESFEKHIARKQSISSDDTNSDSNIMLTSIGSDIVLEEKVRPLHLESLKSSHFRYVGEGSGATESLRGISASLMKSLANLRYVYKKLDRDKML